MQVLLFDAGEAYSQRLLIVIHHLAVDGVSWRILLEDIQTIYGQIQQGKPAQLPPKTTSFQYWANKLADYAQTPALQEQMNYWSKLAHKRFGSLPIDSPGGENSEASTRTVAVSLSKQETDDLLKEVPAVYHTQINDVLLTALAQAYYRMTGSRQVIVELEGHGRVDLFADVDLSRTVGWFTSVYPVLLDLKFSKSPGEAVKTIKEQIHQIPNNGIGFGLLRYLNENKDTIDQLKEIPRAEICFNYLGQFDQVASGSAIFDIAQESKGSDHSPLGKRSHVIEINGSIAGGKLQLDWNYSENLHYRWTIERLAQHFITELKAIIAHCTATETGGFTPSDFTLVKLDQKKLDKVMKKLGKGAGLKKVTA
jgi:non-ribosomal peptide synthase protein (TIGR01720 family)